MRKDKERKDRRRKKSGRRKEREKQAPTAYTSDSRSTVATSITNCASDLLPDHPNYKIMFVTHLIKHTISTITWFISKSILLAKYALFHVIISPFHDLSPLFLLFPTDQVQTSIKRAAHKKSLEITIKL